MKKLLFLILSVLLCFTIFASELKICIVPENNELKKSVEEYFKVKVVNSQVTCNVDLLISGDERLLEYICKKSDAGILLIPVIEKISEYNYMRLYSFNNETKSFNLEYETISKDSRIFDFEAIKTLYNSYLQSIGSVDFYTEETANITEVVQHSLLLDCKNVDADIYLNNKYLGKTPYQLESYEIPSVVEFCAEGFASKTYSLLDSDTSEIVVSLIPEIKAATSDFSKKQNRYFASFAATILGWGSRIFVDALNIQNASLKKALDISTLGLAIGSSAYLGYNIYSYFNSTQNITP